MNELHERLNAALDELEQWAIAASSHHHGVTSTGEHWQWECSTCDTTVPVEPLAEFMECPSCSSVGVDLRSFEQYGTVSSGTLPHMPMPSTEEVEPGAAGHIIRHDPAAVLRQVEAIRGLLTVFAEMLEDFPKDAPGRPTLQMMYEQTVRHLAQAYGVQP